jgi:hypothetical protein
MSKLQQWTSHLFFDRKQDESLYLRKNVKHEEGKLEVPPPQWDGKKRKLHLIGENDQMSAYTTNL